MPEISGTFHKTHIAEGNTMFRLVIRKMAKVKSRSVAEKAHSQPFTSAGKIRGTVTVRKVRAVVAPVTCAASSNSLCSCSNAALSTRVVKGRWAMICAMIKTQMLPWIGVMT